MISLILIFGFLWRSSIFWYPDNLRNIVKQCANHGVTQARPRRALSSTRMGNLLQIQPDGRWTSLNSNREQCNAILNWKWFVWYQELGSWTWNQAQVQFVSIYSLFLSSENILKENIYDTKYWVVSTWQYDNATRKCCAHCGSSSYQEKAGEGGW